MFMSIFLDPVPYLYAIKSFSYVDMPSKLKKNHHNVMLIKY